MTAPMISAFALRSLGRALSRPWALRAKSLGPTLREQLILRVSSVNQCTVCSAIHGGVARLEGLSGDDIRRARNPVADGQQDESTRLLLHYAEIRTADLERDFPDVVEAFERSFPEPVKQEVRAVVDLFTFNNRFNNTWEGLLPGASRRRESMGLTGPRAK
jgi:AhpD family alkylhydroperoxidase